MHLLPEYSNNIPQTNQMACRVGADVLAQALPMARFAMAAYGVPLYLWANKTCGCCALCCGQGYVAQFVPSGVYEHADEQTKQEVITATERVKW